MTHAYSELYLSCAQDNLSSMLDFAVNDAGYELNTFYTLFLKSEVSALFQSGDTSTLAGKSGVELALDVLGDYSLGEKYNPVYDRSPEYWTGWALAYFQWYSSLPFKTINGFIPITEIRDMYNPYHEMDISQFCDHLLELYEKRKGSSNLKRMRIRTGLSQSELADIAGVPVKTLQKWESREKNINAARAETVLALAKALYCHPADLLEVSVSNENL